jgi:tetratricopeptide (TPR) repeat protein
MPREPVPLDLLSRHYLERRKLSQLAPVLDAWQALQPGDTNIQLRRALLLMLQDKPKEAVVIFDALLAQDSDLDSARANRALALLQLKQFDKARSDFEEMLGKDPSNYIYHSGLAKICEQKQDDAGALTHWESYLMYAPRETADYTNAVEKVRVLKKKG